MPRDEKRRQRSLQKQSAKRKQKRHAIAAAGPASGERALLRRAVAWPVLECLATKDWDAEGQIVQIIVARHGPQGQVGAASFLVDLGCLGVKNAFGSLFDSVAEYKDRLAEPSHARQPLKKIALDLAAKIIREANAYARGLGFSPHRDYYTAAVLLEGADPDAARERVPLGGSDGRPFYAAGPYDHAAAIIAKLNKAVGEGNYTFIGPLDMLAPALGLHELEFAPLDEEGEWDEADESDESEQERGATLDVEYRVRRDD